MIRSISILTSAVLLAATFAPAAQAEERIAEATHVAVKADDLATPASVQMLYRRIEQAAKRVCDSDSDESTGITTQEADKACEIRAISDTIQSVNAPQLTQLDPARDRHSTEMAYDNGHYASR